MKKHANTIFIALTVLAVLAVPLTDPIAVAWLLENGLIILLWALSVTVCGAISFCAGYVKGKRIGRSEGFEAGENWASRNRGLGYMGVLGKGKY